MSEGLIFGITHSNTRNNVHIIIFEQFFGVNSFLTCYRCNISLHAMNYSFIVQLVVLKAYKLE